VATRNIDGGPRLSEMIGDAVREALAAWPPGTGPGPLARLVAQTAMSDLKEERADPPDLGNSATSALDQSQRDTGPSHAPVIGNKPMSGGDPSAPVSDGVGGQTHSAEASADGLERGPNPDPVRGSQENPRL
jgi:hypothetical protein